MKVKDLKNALSVVPDDYDVYVDVGACLMDGATVHVDNEDRSVSITYEEDTDE